MHTVLSVRGRRLRPIVSKTETFYRNLGDETVLKIGDSVCFRDEGPAVFTIEKKVEHMDKEFEVVLVEYYATTIDENRERVDLFWIRKELECVWHQCIPPRNSTPTNTHSQKTRSKVVLVGDGSVGKTTWVKRLLAGDFEEKYIPTLGVEVHPIMHEELCPRIFDIWDTAGQEKFGGLRDGYYINANAAIVVFDVTNMLSAASVRKWIDGIRRVSGNAYIPIVVCGNKVDIREREVPIKWIKKLVKEKNVKYFDLSTKSCYNHFAPFIYIDKALTTNN